MSEWETTTTQSSVKEHTLFTQQEMQGEGNSCWENGLSQCYACFIVSHTVTVILCHVLSETGKIRTFQTHSDREETAGRMARQTGIAGSCRLDLPTRVQNQKAHMCDRLWLAATHARQNHTFTHKTHPRKHSLRQTSIHNRHMEQVEAGRKPVNDAGQ